jgi:small neutral amino acid transporter SnatA (MarC family)
MKLRLFIFCFAAILSPLAAVMSLLTFYEQYAQEYTDKRKLLKTALAAAVFTLVVFLALGLLLVIFLPFCI